LSSAITSTLIWSLIARASGSRSFLLDELEQVGDVGRVQRFDHIVDRVCLACAEGFLDAADKFRLQVIVLVKALASRAEHRPLLRHRPARGLRGPSGVMRPGLAGRVVKATADGHYLGVMLDSSRRLGMTDA
jgi:hypothetical protein